MFHVKNLDSFVNDLKQLHIELSDETIQQFVDYYDLLIEWNAVMNLTAITDFDEVLKKHFVDSLSFIKAKDIIGAIGALTGIKSEKIGHIEVGDNSLMYVKNVKIDGLIKLETINIGQNLGEIILF